MKMFITILKAYLITCVILAYFNLIVSVNYQSDAEVTRFIVGAVFFSLQAILAALLFHVTSYWQAEAKAVKGKKTSK